MAEIVGGIFTSHVPAIGNAIAKGLQRDPYWAPFFDGYAPLQGWLRAKRPDVAVVFYNDHGLNFFLDKMPAFAVGAAPEYRNADEGWGLPTLAPFRGDPEMSWHLIETLAAADFDLTTCQEMLVDHGFVVPMQLLWPGGRDCPVRTVRACRNAASPRAHRPRHAGTALQRDSGPAGREHCRLRLRHRPRRLVDGRTRDRRRG